MSKKLELLIERKKILRLLTEAQSNNDREEVRRLQEKADTLLERASAESESLTVENIYGLMGN